MKIRVSLLYVLTVVCVSLSAQQTSVLRITLENYARNSVSLSFMQTPALSMDFPYNRENPQPIDYSFDLRVPEIVYLNGQLMYVEPGDETDFLFRYNDNRKLEEVRVLSGNNPRSVAANTRWQQVRAQRLEDRFKIQNLAWVAIALAPQEHFDRNLLRIQSEQAFWKTHRHEMGDEAYHTLLSESEGVIYANMIEYPMMAADVLKMPLDSCFANGYTRFLDGYAVREDAASLQNRNYGIFLIARYRYLRMKTAIENRSIGSLAPQSPEELFNGLAAHYNGAVRDAALYCMLAQTLSESRMEFSAFEKLYEKYIRHYNKEASFRADLERMMQ